MLVSGVQSAAYFVDTASNATVQPVQNDLKIEVKTDSVQAPSPYVWDRDAVLEKLRQATNGSLSRGSLQNQSLEDRVSKFVVNQSFLRDQIIRNTQGEEQIRQLSDFDEKSEQYINEIADSVTSSITAFMNAQSRSIFNNNESDQQGFLKGFVPMFNNDGLKQQVVDLLHNKQQQFNQSKQGDAKWETILSTGAGLEQAVKQFKQEAFSTSSGESESFDRLSERDLVGVYAAVELVKGGLSSLGSSQLVIPELGLGLAKLNLYLEHTSMSQFVKDKIWDTISAQTANKLKIQNEIDAQDALVRGSMGGAGMAGAGNSLKGYKPYESDRMLDRFAHLGKMDSKSVKKSFLDLQQLVKTSLVEVPVIFGSVSKEKKMAFADSLVQGYAEDWNTFISSLSMDEDTKKDYLVPTHPGDTFDKKI